MTVAPLPAEERAALRSLLDARRAGDAMPAYYAFHHPPAKVRVWVHRGSIGAPDGFVARAQTGVDLFRPLIVLRAADSASARELLRAALPEGQGAIFSLPAESESWALPLAPVEPPATLRLLRLNPARFQPLINIFVRTEKSPDGRPRAEIRRPEGRGTDDRLPAAARLPAADRLVASAGINWMSPDAAEIFVQTDPEFRERGFGKSVASALCVHLLGERRQVLYAVEADNPRSLALAESLGFEDTGARERVFRGARSDSAAPGAHLEIRA